MTDRFAPLLRRVALSFHQSDETSWLQETQDMYRANAVSLHQDSEEMLALLLNAVLMCGMGMLMYALCA
ncbi:hypothetical protein [Variovorax sp. HJSM1_2]|uniref:hypothetical protein n=1 Tax=Variovorax sp. HJSM1_2 TaxID=3366263 RepID=UPI003BD2CEC7